MVIHILKDGTRVDNIVGHIVKVSEAETVYKLMTKINRNGGGLRRDKGFKRN